MPLAALDNPLETNVSDVLTEPIGWIVAHTEPNQEKEFVRKLPPKCPYALPYLGYYNKSRHLTLKPIFTHYVFVGERRGSMPSKMKVPITNKAVIAARQTKRCLNTLVIGDQFLFRHQLSLLLASPPEKRAISDDFPQNGQKVQFTEDSPYRGMQGVVDKLENRLYVRVCTLGRIISIETEAWKLEPVG